MASLRASFDVLVIEQCPTNLKQKIKKLRCSDPLSRGAGLTELTRIERGQLMTTVVSKVILCKEPQHLQDSFYQMRSMLLLRAG
jgi:hypothetical protein